MPCQHQLGAVGVGRCAAEMGSRGSEEQMSLWSFSTSIMIALWIIRVVREVAQSDAVSCSCVKIGRKLLGFAVAELLFPPLW